MSQVMAQPASPTAARSATPRDARPVVAVIVNVPTPYRLALHARIERELPEIRLVTLYTHDVADQGWKLNIGARGGGGTPSPGGDSDPAQSVFFFGQGDAVHESSRLRNIPRELSKGGRICALLDELKPALVMLCGYNDPGRLRILRHCNLAHYPVFMVADSNSRGEVVAGLKALVKPTFVRWVMCQCAGAMPCGNYGAEYFEQYGVTRDRIFFVPYEPDYALIESISNEQIRAAMSDFALDAARRRFVFCARMIDVKRPLLAIDAFARVAPARPEWDLVMIGDGPLLPQVRERAAALGPRVKFTGFVGEQARISAIYRASHVLVHPSVYEPWGVVINEAACAGMAIVSARGVGAAGELVRDDVNGRLVGEDDLRGFADALASVSQSDTLDRLRAGSPAVLSDWRARGDPVEGIRKALRFCRVLPPATV